MNILFLYNHPLIAEKGGTSRATSLAMQELSRRGHTCMGHLHFNDDDPDQCYYNDTKVESLTAFLHDHNIDVVINQLGYKPALLKTFLHHGGKEWQEGGGKILSILHFDPSRAPFSVLQWLRSGKGQMPWSLMKRLVRLPLLLRSRWKQEERIRRGYRYIYEHSDRYIVLSPSYIPAFAQRMGLTDPKKLRVIPNMLTFPTIADDSILTEKERTIVVVARLMEKHKRISLILKTWHTIPEHGGYTLQILGDGPDADMYRQMIKDMGICDVQLLGQQDPLPYYRKAQMSLLASPREGWGLVITESLQNGVVPVVMDTSTVFHDILTDGKDGYLCSDQREFRHRIEALMTDEALRHRLALNGLRRAAAFTPDRAGEIWEKVLADVASSKTTAPIVNDGSTQA